MSSKAQLRKQLLQQRHLKEENRKYGLGLVEIGPEHWPAGHAPNLLRTLRNRHFLVQIYLEASNLYRLSINRTALNNQMDWEDGISWEELQALKDQAGFADFDAVEVYPRQGDVVNRTNIRHLWVLESPLPFVWRVCSQPATPITEHLHAEAAPALSSSEG